ncbi:hypothetical protein [Mixta mediterraneensis]|uniref:hypothetical protein n=1 Tax=Mixta mediterraneensis TaxID=2758443 RepID=UPI0018761D64|nr:hypothetical protein [Mixta mediterraneensis]
MLVLALMDYLAVNFNRKIVFGTIVMESLSNAILLTTLKIIIFFSSFNHHTSLTVIEDLVNKFGSMYVANLIGSMIAFVINFFIFSYLYKAKSFLTSSILSSLIMLLIYTPITDLIAFKDLPIVNIIEIIGTNIISNIIFFIFWSAILSTQIKKEMQYA